MKKIWLSLTLTAVVLTAAFPISTSAADIDSPGFAESDSVESTMEEISESVYTLSNDTAAAWPDIEDSATVDMWQSSSSEGSASPDQEETILFTDTEDADAEDSLVLDSDEENAALPSVVYTTHVQTYGWLDPVSDGLESGTTGQSKRLEGIRISLENSSLDGSVQYCTHVQTYGWQDWRADGAMAGTEGEAKRLEAIRICLTGELSEHYDIWYQTHIQHFGWSGWAVNGEPCGSAGYSYRLEAIRILLVPRGTDAPGGTSGIFREKSTGVTDGASAYDGTWIRYCTHVQTYGWQDYVFDGSSSGTTGQSKRLEGIRIALTNLPVDGGIQYRTHVQTYGWQDWRADGAMAGTAGEAKRLEAIQIALTGAAADSYDVYYRVHSQTYGWMAWTRNGQSAGTEGMSKRLEAIEIRILPKNETMPGYDPDQAFKRQISGGTVTWIGDSYSAINRNVIASKLPGVDIQAQGSKFISWWGAGGTPGIPLATSLKQSGQLRKTVVFALGTNSNDGVTQNELNQLRSLFGDAYKVVFVTARTNRATYSSGNALLRNFVKQYANYYLYDWDANFQPSYMGGDGVHPNSTGIQVWVDGIIDVLNTTL